MDKHDLEKLTVAFTKGSSKAFQTLHERYKKAISGYIVSHCFGQLKQRADDIAQETWSLIWEKRAQFDTSRSFYTFVCYWANIMIKRHLCHLNDNVSLDDEEQPVLADESTINEETLSEEMEMLFEITFTKGGPPHQLIAFGLNKLLSQWKPRNIVSELADLPLSQLLEILIRDYIAASRLSESQVYSLFWPLRAAMTQYLEQVLDDEVSKTTYKEFLYCKVGETKLKNYFSQDPVHNISDWCYKVRNRVTRYFSKNSDKCREKAYLKSVS